MKREILIPALSLLCCAAVAGCAPATGAGQERPVAVYSFHGENAHLKLSNGVIVLTPEKEILYGGALEAGEGAFADAAACTVTYYLASDGGEASVLMSNSVSDHTGGAVNVSGWTGSISGDVFDGDDVERLEEQLTLAVEIRDIYGEPHRYDLPLTVREVTGTGQ